MIDILKLIFLIILIFGLPLLLFLILEISVHREMTIEKTKHYGYGNFNKFKQQFEKIDWDTNWEYKGSFFNILTDSKIHASIYKFNGIGMVILNPIDYVKILLFLREETSKSYKTWIHKW